MNFLKSYILLVCLCCMLVMMANRENDLCLNTLKGNNWSAPTEWESEMGGHNLSGQDTGSFYDSSYSWFTTEEDRAPGTASRKF